MERHLVGSKGAGLESVFYHVLPTTLRFEWQGVVQLHTAHVMLRSRKQESLDSTTPKLLHACASREIHPAE